MRISAITPTYQREPFLRALYDYFKAQTHLDKEWLIWDDSPEPSAFFSLLDDPEVRYFHSPIRQPIGEKRNRLIEQATGECIAHFDDDDYYAPAYLATMLSQLEHLDFVKLSAWYVYAQEQDFWGYFDPEHPAVKHYHLKSGQSPSRMDGSLVDVSMLWGYGFSYAYHKCVWEAFPFQHLNFGEDHTLVLEHLLSSQFKIGYFRDLVGLVLHILHRNNTSESFPQYQLTLGSVPKPLLTGCTSLNSP